jgi:hypothetical protein
MDFRKLNAEGQTLEMISALFPGFHNNKQLKKLWTKIDELIVNPEAEPEQFAKLFKSAVAGVNPQDRFVCEYFAEGFIHEPTQTMEKFMGLLEKHSRYLAGKEKAAEWRNYIK